ncbi:metaxin-1 [Protopterus annectens]|uniref:metaxin-1 n=1 Tax=Protopterus annectens TaxID=7888 RepID=UPI001CFAA755|nr:metaxin-1 [Protopterus annectens]
MAAPMELYCWKGDWGLPTVDVECLTVLTYAKFAGAPLKVRKITNPWRSPSGSLPALKSVDEGVLCQPHKIITHLRKQKYNADYDLSAKQGADTMAFISLLEEKLLPAVIYSFWVDSKNYVDHTRKWYAEAIPFPLNFFLPNRLQGKYLERLRLTKGSGWCEEDEEKEKELFAEARECMNLLSQKLGTQKFFFGDSPASLDAYVFSHLALLLKAKLPNGKLQQHLKSLDNLCSFCTSILSLYFPGNEGEPNSKKMASSGNSTDLDDDPFKRRKQILSVVVGLAAMIGYAFLSGIVSIERVSAAKHLTDSSHLHDDDDEE